MSRPELIPSIARAARGGAINLRIPRHSELVAALVIYVGLSAWCQSVIPLDYGPDEPYHMQYVHILAEYGRLPLPGETYQAHHPPTYYLLALPLYKLSGNHVEPLGPRPAWALEKDFDAREILARRLIRPLSTLLGATTIAALYALLLVAGVPRLYRLPLLLLAGGLPMFIYITSLVNNEPLTYLWSAVTALWLVQLIYLKRPLRWQDAAIAGALVGGGLIIKQTTLFALPIALVVLVLRRSPGQKSWRMVLSFAAFFLLAGIWWPLHNVIVSGQPFPNYALHPADQPSTLQDMVTYPDGWYLLRGWTRNILASAVVPDWVWAEGMMNQAPLLAATQIVMLLAAIAALVVLRRAYGGELAGQAGEVARRDALCVWASLLAGAALWAGIIWFCISVDYRAQSGGRYLLNALPYLVVLLGVALRPPSRLKSTPPDSSPGRYRLIVGGIILIVAAVIVFNAWWLVNSGRYYTSL